VMPQNQPARRLACSVRRPCNQDLQRKAAKKAAPLVLRRGFLVIGAGSVVFIVGRVAVRKVRQRRLDGTADEQLSSGDRNAELARRSNTAVLDVDAPMPVRPEHANGSKTSMPFPR